MDVHDKVAAAVLFLALGCISHAQEQKMRTATAGKVVEILTIEVKPGKRDQFHKIYESQALPLLRKWKFDVVAYGPSLHDDNSYYVIRSFASLDDRQKSEDAYYSSADWRNGPREAILAIVDHFAYTVLPAETLKEITNEIFSAKNQPSRQGGPGKEPQN
jgi:hypothetical protein